MTFYLSLTLDIHPHPCSHLVPLTSRPRPRLPLSIIPSSLRNTKIPPRNPLPAQRLTELAHPPQRLLQPLLHITLFAHRALDRHPLAALPHLHLAPLLLHSVPGSDNLRPEFPDPLDKQQEFGLAVGGPDDPVHALGGRGVGVGFGQGGASDPGRRRDGVGVEGVAAAVGVVEGVGRAGDFGHRDGNLLIDLRVLGQFGLGEEGELGADDQAHGQLAVDADEGEFAFAVGGLRGGAAVELGGGLRRGEGAAARVAGGGGVGEGVLAWHGTGGWCGDEAAVGRGGGEEGFAGDGFGEVGGGGIFFGDGGLAVGTAWRRWLFVGGVGFRARVAASSTFVGVEEEFEAGIFVLVRLA